MEAQNDLFAADRSLADGACDGYFDTGTTPELCGPAMLAALLDWPEGFEN